jgi:hypothetical protein
MLRLLMGDPPEIATLKAVARDAGSDIPQTNIADMLSLPAAAPFLGASSRELEPLLVEGREHGVSDSPFRAILELGEKQAGFLMAALFVRIRTPRHNGLAHLARKQAELLARLRCESMIWSEPVAEFILKTYASPQVFERWDCTPEILERSFPAGLPHRVRRLVSALSEAQSIPDRHLFLWECARIATLERLLGRDPQAHPRLRAELENHESYLRHEAEQWPRFSARMTRILDTLVARPDLPFAELKAYETGLGDLSPEERAEFFVDVMRVRFLRSQPGFFAASKSADHPRATAIGRCTFVDRVYGRQNTLKAAFTDRSAKEFVRLGATEYRDGRVTRTNLDSLRPALIKRLARAIETPDKALVDRIRTLRRHGLRLEPLVERLCPDTAPAPAPPRGRSREFQLVADARRKLQNTLQRLPGLWLDVPVTATDGPYRFTHQLYPYYAEINLYLSRLEQLVRQGFACPDELADFRSLVAHGKRNLEELGRGRFFGDGSAARTKDLPQAELENRDNPFWSRHQPEEHRSVIDHSGKLKRGLIAALEDHYVTRISEALERLEAAAGAQRGHPLPDHLVPERSQSRPTKTWLTRARADLSPDALERILEQISGLPSQEAGHAGPHDGRWMERQTIGLRPVGCIWAAHLLGPRAADTLYDVALRSYAKVPGVGPRLEFLGNAAVISLALIEDGAGLTHLLRLRNKVVFSGIKKRITRELDRAAEAAGVTPDQLQEIATIDHGLASGTRRIPLAAGAAILEAAGGDLVLSWEDAGGAPRKGLPKALKEADPQGVKKVRALKADIESDLKSWKGIYEASYLREQRWPYEIWRTRHADHGTRALLARRLIWVFETGTGEVVGRPVAEGCVDAAGRPLDCKGSTVRLWHPLDASAEETATWRDAFIAADIIQPFRQVWRETFTLTEAERATATYSNRFAGHVVRQHQLMALGVANGWQSTHRTGFDTPDDEPTHIRLPDVGLQAEFWTGALAADSPMSPAGAYLYLSTDRVKFHRLDEAAAFGRGPEIALTEVPPRVLSEILRHCDLFTSVASISLDPEWEDQGPDANHPTHWRHHADSYWRQSHRQPLVGSAQTRREMLARIVPRLKCANALSLEASHLRVQGRRNTYLIHIGSGAVYLADRARHVCIVPTARSQDVMLPFEGDRVLSLILSKALMLVDDDAITDPVILAQIS